ncbi:MAG: DUF2752 domain-containing protein [Armatimonadetes bacterium]|nr:DUF2752 domain-containing protein [Armatimonadota bacterium]
MAVLAMAHILQPGPPADSTLRPSVIAFPCLFREFTGVPCPGCGLTRSVCATAHGMLARAFAHHYLGPMVYLAAWVVLVWSLIALAARTEGPDRFLSHPRVLKVLLAAFLGAWVVRLLIMLG